MNEPDRYRHLLTVLVLLASASVAALMLSLAIGYKNLADTRHAQQEIKTIQRKAYADGCKRQNDNRQVLRNLLLLSAAHAKDPAKARQQIRPYLALIPIVDCTFPPTTRGN